MLIDGPLGGDGGEGEAGGARDFVSLLLCFDVFIFLLYYYFYFVKIFMFLTQPLLCRLTIPPHDGTMCTCALPFVDVSPVYRLLHHGGSSVHEREEHGRYL